MKKSFSVLSHSPFVTIIPTEENDFHDWESYLDLFYHDYTFKGKGIITVLPATEIVSSKEFFDYEAKYVPGVCEEITPGRMTAEEVDRVGRIVTKVYEKLNCKGAVRIDYFLQHETGKFYFIEINTVPGQTETSLISQQVKATGKSIKDFYTELIEEMFV